jgi:hypothetical protein
MEAFKVAKTPNANLQNERKKPQCKKKPQTNHKLNLGNQRIEDQT